MCNGFKGFGREFNIHVLHGKKHLILANNGIFRFCQDLNERFFIEFFKNRNHRQTTDQLRNQTVLHKVTRFNLTEDIREVVIFLPTTVPENRFHSFPCGGAQCAPFRQTHRRR